MKKIIIILLGILILCGFTKPLTKDSKDADLISHTIAEARAYLGLQFDEYFVIDEPPGVPRGIHGLTANGEEVELYIHRGDVPFNERRTWKLSDFDNKKVVGVARLKSDGKWHVYGEVILIRTMGANRDK